jgi:hypothetical protein
MEDLVTRKEVDTSRRYLAPAFGRQHRNRGGKTAEPEQRPLAGVGRGFYPGYVPGMQECGEPHQQTAVVAADVEDALDRPANLCLNMLKQT